MSRDFFNHVCYTCSLGKLKSPPKRVNGGLMHQMFELCTSQGHYAVKLLNPHIMERPTALANYFQADQLEIILESHGLSIIPALSIEGKKLQKIDNQYFYLYNWYEGKSLKANQIRVKHAKRIGAELAKIHRVDEKMVKINPTMLQIDWDYDLTLLKQSNGELFNLIKKYRDLLYERQEKANIASKRMPLRRSICHNDLDCKNVLWNQDDFRIIDLECLSYGDPLLEMYETALYWAGYDIGYIDVKLLEAFIDGYTQFGGKLPLDWEMVYDSSQLSLAWLEYNIQRALGINCSIEEQKMGISEVKQTMLKIVCYHDSKKKILECLTQITEGRDV